MFLKKWKHLAWAVVLSVGLIYLYIDVGKETKLMGSLLEGYPTLARPAFWPQFMIVGLLITSLMYIYFHARESENKSDRAEVKNVLNLKVIISILIVSIYCFFSQYLGFTLATIVFMSIYMWFLGVRDFKKLILVPVVSVVVILIFFWRLLYLAVPKGEWIFLEFSNFIMSIVRYGA